MILSRFLSFLGEEIPGTVGCAPKCVPNGRWCRGPLNELTRGSWRAMLERKSGARTGVRKKRHHAGKTSRSPKTATLFISHQAVLVRSAELSSLDSLLLGPGTWVQFQAAVVAFHVPVCGSVGARWRSPRWSKWIGSPTLQPASWPRCTCGVFNTKTRLLTTVLVATTECCHSHCHSLWMSPPLKLSKMSSQASLPLARMLLHCLKVWYHFCSKAALL